MSSIFNCLNHSIIICAQERDIFTLSLLYCWWCYNVQSRILLASMCQYFNLRSMIRFFTLIISRPFFLSKRKKSLFERFNRENLPFHRVCSNLSQIPIEHCDCLLSPQTAVLTVKDLWLFPSTRPVHLWLYLHMALRIRFNLLRQSNGLITLKRWQERECAREWEKWHTELVINGKAQP